MRSIVLVTFFCTAIGLGAQSYRVLLDTLNTWQETFHLHYSVDPPGGSTDECYLYYMEGDTLLNDTAYHLLRKTGHATVVDFGDQWFSGTLFAFVREDTAARRAFIRDLSSAQEQLMYDFSAGLGPYPWTYPLPVDGLVVIAEGTFVAMDGPHRTLLFDGGAQIIEGIGLTTGFVGTQSSALYSSGIAGLVCQRVDGSAVYTGVNDPDCICGSNVGIPAPVRGTMRISPIPTRDLLQIDGATPNAPFFIHTMDGRAVRSGRCSSYGSSIVDMTGLTAAIYVLEVIESTGSLRVKVIKE